VFEGERSLPPLSAAVGEGGAQQIVACLGEAYGGVCNMHDKLSRLARRVRELDEGLEKHRRGDEMKHAMSKVQELGKRLKEVEEGREEDVERHEHQLKLAVIEAKAHGKAESAALQEELAVLYNNHGSACKKLGDMGKAVQMFTLARQRQEDVSFYSDLERTVSWDR